MSTALKKRKQLDQFMSRVMEPLSEGALTDFEYNRLAREARRGAWQRGEAVLAVYKARIDLQHALWIFDMRCAEKRPTEEDEDASHEKLWKLREGSEAATVALMRTPAPDKLAIAWKRARLSDDALFRHTRLTLEEAERLIAADEAFLEAHPLKKGRAA